MIDKNSIRNSYLDGNNQYILETLAELPVAHAWAEDYKLYITMSRPLTTSEGYVLGSLGSGVESIENDQVEFELWFD